MTRKTRITPFARFFIFLLFAAPLAYLGASYYRGEDGIAKIKTLLGKIKEDQSVIEVQMPPDVKEIATSDRADIEAKLDSILQNQQIIIEILKSNLEGQHLSKPDSI